MAIKFNGEFTSPRSQEEVYDFLADPNKFGPLLPDFESMTLHDATHFTVKVRVGVGNIRGSAEIKMELAEASRPQRALYKGQGTAVGSQITISAGFDLSPLPESTRVAWQGEANVFGKLASMAGGMLEPVGKKNIQKLIDGLQWALTWPPAQVIAKEAPSGAMQGASAEQPVQGDQQVPSAALQAALAEQPPDAIAEELPGAGVQSAAAEPIPTLAAEEGAGTPNAAAEETPQPATDGTAHNLDDGTDVTSCGREVLKDIV